MPTYDYLCDGCGHRFEEFQSMSAKALRKCPACKKSALQRLIGAGAGVIFKGSGFYQTDYRSDSYSSDAKKDAGTTATGGCAPTCGTPDAPTGCKMAKKDPE
jgi:putative FmdB family regulatory protein